jgi:hypothetical protein
MQLPPTLLFFDKGKPTKDVWCYEHRMPEDYKAYSKTRPFFCGKPPIVEAN